MTNGMAGEMLVKSIKTVAGSPGPQLVLPVGSPLVGFLRPVANEKSVQNTNDITFLTNWRNKYQKSFLTEFDASVTQTSNWLSNYVYQNNDRILFMIDLVDGQTIGYAGLAHIDWENNYGEADAIVRGKQAPKGTMQAALTVLLTWAEGQLRLKNIGVRVLSDNPALEFFRKCGFVETKRVPLSKKIVNGNVTWIEDENNAKPDRTLVHHMLKKD